MSFRIDKTVDFIDQNGNVKNLATELGKIGAAGATNLDGLTDVDTSTIAPSEGNVLQYQGGTWKPGTVSGSSSASNAYIIELSRWGISNDGTNPANTTTGINNAISWAVSQAYNYIKLPAGTYTITKGSAEADKTACIILQSNIILDLMGCTLQKETNAYNTYYIIF